MTVGVTIDTEEVHFGFLDNWDTLIIPSAAEAPITPVLHTLSHTHTLWTLVYVCLMQQTLEICVSGWPLLAKTTKTSVSLLLPG